LIENDATDVELLMLLAAAPPSDHATRVASVYFVD